MKNLSPEKKCLLVVAIMFAIGLLAVVPVGFTTKYWGPTTGWILGCGVTIISQILMFKSGDIISGRAKESGTGTGLSVLFYFSRFILYGVAFAVCIVLHYVVTENETINILFNWSWITCAIPLFPSTIILAIFYHDNDKGNK